jgi:hypothetical protein
MKISQSNKNLAKIRQKYRTLYKNIGHFTKVSDTSQKYRALYENIGQFTKMSDTTKLSDTLRKYRTIYKNIGHYKKYRTHYKNIGHFTQRRKQFLLLPVKSNCHDSAIFDCNGITFLGWPRRYKYYCAILRICREPVLLYSKGKGKSAPLQARGAQRVPVS